MKFLLFFITITLFLLICYLFNYNDKGKYIAIGTIIALLIISSITIHKYQQISFYYDSMVISNYNSFIGSLTINRLTDSTLEQNEKLNSQVNLLLNKITELDNIYYRSSLFTSESMEETFLELKEVIYSIDNKIKEKNYSLEKSVIIILSEYLGEIGSLLGSKAEHREYNIFGIATRKIDYEDDTSNKVEELINEINKVLDIV